MSSTPQQTPNEVTMATPNHQPNSESRAHARGSRPRERRRHQARRDRAHSGMPPLTVWRCGTTPIDTTAAMWQGPVAEQIVASFSVASDHVVLLDTDPAQAPTSTALASNRVANLGRHPHVLPADHVATPELKPAGLVMATVRPHQPPSAAAIATWVAPLRQGGVLAMLTRTAHHGGLLVDPTGAIVAAAQSAGLRYLQHIIVLPTSNDATSMTATGRTTRSRSHARNAQRPASRRHKRVHADLLVFHQPATTAPTHASGDTP